MELWLAVDGTGTTARMLLADREGVVYDRQSTDSLDNPYLDDTKEYTQRIQKLLRTMKAAMNEPTDTVTRAGIVGPAGADVLAKTIRDVFGEVECTQLDEGDIGLASHRLSFGVTLVAGIHSYARGVNEAGETRYCGRFGAQFGDEGSLYWIGRAGIAAVGRALEGRSGPTLLQERLCASFDLNDPWELFEQASRNGRILNSKVARFAHEVIEAARANDEPAWQVCRTAGRSLAELAIGTARVSGIEKKPVPLAPTGEVFAAGPLVIGPMKRFFAEKKARFKVHPQVVDLTQGVLAVLRQTARSSATT